MTKTRIVTLSGLLAVLGGTYVAAMGVSAVDILREPLDALSAVTLAFIIVAILTAAVFVPAVIVTIYHDYTNERDT